MEDCLFCKILKGEIPSNAVYEDGYFYAFNDIEPQAPVHVVMIPKKHYENIMEVPPDDETLKHLAEAIQNVVKKTGLQEKGFRVVMNTGEEGGQTVGHLHFHILGKRSLKWPPG